jgi:hypothetical protein
MFGLDEFYGRKLAQWSAPVGEAGHALDPAAQSRRFAARWLMIPVTRAMDTLVIQLQGSGSELAGILREMAQGECSDTLEWINAGQPSGT